MQRFAYAAFAALIAACSTERVEIVHEMVGCTSDAMCDDRDGETLDWCEAGSGFCNHERVVEVGLCASAADCDDADPETVDACEGGDCHHTREVAAPYDPRAHQDHVAYCESPVPYCSEGSDAPSVGLPFGGCGGERHPWNELGYRMYMRFGPIVGDSTRIVIRPSLRAGDPDDLFRVTVEVDTRGDGWPDEPVLVQDLTAAVLATDGLAVTLTRPMDGTATTFTVTFDFAQPDAYRSRALQWALLPGGVVDAESGADLVPCPLVGPYVDVPEHGLLRLTEDVGGGTPRCEGVVRGPDAWYAMPGVRPSSLFRTVSDSTLRYATDLEVPQRIIEFRSMREFIDWFRHPGGWHPFTDCALASVVPDAVYETARAAAIVEQVGVRPGMYVSWTDPATLVRHYGIADKQWTLRDLGTSESVLYTWEGIPCTAYQIFTDFSTECVLDLQWPHGYTTVPTDPATIDPVEIDERSGWLHWYNRDLPSGP